MIITKRVVVLLKIRHDMKELSVSLQLLACFITTRTREAGSEPPHSWRQSAALSSPLQSSAEVVDICVCLLPVAFFSDVNIYSVSRSQLSQCAVVVV